MFNKIKGSCLVFLLPAVLLSFGVFAQQINFTKEYFNTGKHNASRFVELSDSGFILVGSYHPTLSNNPEYSFAMRLNKYGDTIWTRNYILNAGEIYGITTIDDNTYMVSGGFIYPGGLALSIEKINLNGDTLWHGEYGYANTGWALKIHKTNDSGFIMENAIANDYGFLKLDSATAIQWHNWQNMQIGCSEILQDYDGGYIAVGGSYGNSPYEVARLDSAGGVTWQYHYGNTSSTSGNEKFASDVVIMTDSNYLVGTNGDDWNLMKIDRNTGDTLWTRNYDSTFYYSYKVYCMDYAGNNNYVLGTASYFMMVNSNGDSIWKTSIPFSPYTQLWDVHKTKDKGYAFCGQYYNASLGYLAIIFVKLDSLGNAIVTSVFNPENNLQPLSFYPSPASNEINISPGSMAAERNLTFALCDMQGRSVLQQQYNASKPVDVSALPEGLYIATLKGKEKEVRGKVMVQR